jgi:hypothetical protein
MGRFRVRCEDGFVVLDPSEGGFWGIWTRQPPMNLRIFNQIVLKEKARVDVWATSRGTPWWRLPSGWNWFFVNGAGGRGGRGYPHHSSVTAQPDFKSAALPVPIPEFSFRFGFGAGIQGIIDRYGNRYVAIDVGGGIGGSIATYFEGYVSADWVRDRQSIPNERDLRDTIEGLDFGAQAGIPVVGGGAGSGLGRAGTVVLSLGLQAEASGGANFTFWIQKIPGESWDWIDRVPGYTREDIRRQDFSELGVCSECAELP